jgi:hypothetical protein
LKLLLLLVPEAMLLHVIVLTVVVPLDIVILVRGVELLPLESIKIFRGNLTYVTNQTQRVFFLTRPRSRSYKKVIGSWNQCRASKAQRKHNSVQVKVTSEATTIKIRSMGFSLAHTHFNKHLTCVIKKSPQNHNKKLEKLKS